MSGVGYAMAEAYWTSAFASWPGFLGSFPPPFTCSTVKVASFVSLLKSVMNLVRSARLGDAARKPIIPSVFLSVATGVYANVLYMKHRYDGSTSLSRLDSTVASFPDASCACAAVTPKERLRGVCRSMREGAMYVVGATA